MAGSTSCLTLTAASGGAPHPLRTRAETFAERHSGSVVRRVAASAGHRSAVSRRLRSARQRAWSRVAAPRGRRARPEVPASEPVPAQPPEAVLDLLRNLGVAMSRAGDPADRITQILDDVARVYAAAGVTFFVVPTGVFVRIDLGTSSRVDFKAGATTPLRLDQVDALYRLIDDIRHSSLDVDAASQRLRDLLSAQPRFGGLLAVLGGGVLTLGLGLMLNPTPSALPAFLVLGFLVGGLRWWADHEAVLSLVLPVAASFVVTWVVFQWVAPALDAAPLDIVIPALVTFLPGAALTMATVELSTGDMLAGSARLVYGLERLLLLSFGIAMGAQLAGLPPPSGEGARALGTGRPGWESWSSASVSIWPRPRPDERWAGCSSCCTSGMPRRPAQRASSARWARVSSPEQSCFPCATPSRAVGAGLRRRSRSCRHSGCWSPAPWGLRAWRRSSVPTRLPDSATFSTP